MKVSNFFLSVLLVSASSAALADDWPSYCPEGDYNIHLRSVSYREKDGWVTFTPKENAGKLQNNVEYWLSNYKMDSAWAKAAYATGLTAATTGARVWITCDGTTANKIYIYND